MFSGARLPPPLRPERERVDSLARRLASPRFSPRPRPSISPARAPVGCGACLTLGRAPRRSLLSLALVHVRRRSRRVGRSPSPRRRCTSTPARPQPAAGRETASRQRPFSAGSSGEPLLLAVRCSCPSQDSRRSSKARSHCGKGLGGLSAVDGLSPHPARRAQRGAPRLLKKGNARP